MPLRFLIRLCSIWLALVTLSSVVAAEAGADPAAQSFAIPAGAAERTLGVFSRQSQQPAIFTTDLLDGVRTHAVRGEYTPFEALSIMLAGTTLQPVHDATSGALVVRVAPPGEAPVVELPPYVVETQVDTERWSYAAAPGVEVISRCADTTTTQLLNHHFRLNAMLAVMLPEEFRVQLDVPTTYVLFNQMTQPGVPREMVSAALNRPNGAGSAVGALSNYRFRDRDAVSIFFIIDELTFNQGRISFTSDYIRYVLESRAPALPPWFIEGMMDVYETARLESVDPNVVRPGSVLGPQPVEGVFSLRPAVWISEAETQLVKKNPRQRRELLPMAQLFDPQAAAATDPARAQLWRSQAALLVRWALQGGGNDARSAAFWEFVRRTSRDPVTETMFRDCFGLDYATMEQQLRDYVPLAVKATIYLHTDKPLDLPVVEPRDATDGEVSRIKGGLDRLEIAYVRTYLPALTARYVQQARRTLRKAYDKGDHDPRLLAELGLCEIDAGDDEAARPFLETATRMKVVRPRAYFELARLNYEEVVAVNPEGKLSVADAAPILRPLAAALKQSPQLPEIYELIATVWLRAEARLTPAQLAVLDTGVRNFQWRTRLIYSAALLNLMSGRAAESQALIDRGLKVCTAPKDRERFLKLAAAIAASPPAQP